MRWTLQSMGLVLLAACLQLGGSGCGDDDGGVSCGEGTVEQDGRCVPEEAPRDRQRTLPDVGVDTSDVAPSEVGPELEDETLPVTPEVEPVDDPADEEVEEPQRDDGSCNVELGVIGDWDGTWEGRVWGSHPLAGGDFNQLAFGDLTFEIFCENSKLLIEGEMTGMANGTFPFQGRLVGEFNPETGAVDMDLIDASVNMMILNVQFVADLTGQLVGRTFENGVWSGESTNPTGAFGSGTWTASAR